MSTSLIDDLNAHQALCQELLAIAQEESDTMRQGNHPSLIALAQQRRTLLPRLDESLQRLRKGRSDWRKLSADERAGDSAVRQAIRDTQELCLKFMVLDRENEQRLLRRGIVSIRPAVQPEPPRPHYVAGLYRRQSQTGSQS
jgi:flagellar biosynthesis/type III secretory pathway chaperone